MFTVIHLKSYTKQEFVEIAVKVLSREEGIEKDVATVIEEFVLNKASANIRECIRIAWLSGNDFSKVKLIADISTKYNYN